MRAEVAALYCLLHKGGDMCRERTVVAMYKIDRGYIHPQWVKKIEVWAEMYARTH